MDPTSLVDLERYPIVDLGGAGGVVADRHAALFRPGGATT